MATADLSREEQRREEKERQELVKEANRKAEFVGRQVQALDDVANGIKKRHKLALEKVQILKWELDQKQKNIDFAVKQRDELERTIKDNHARAEQLRLAQRRAQRIMANSCSEMKDARHMAISGRPHKDPELHVPGLRRVNKNMISLALEDLRGYSCKEGSTCTAAEGLSRSMPALPQMRA
eukprot:CAMPEP_0169084842 /NCGR_PEP_ID=MMETSP1015-20121227/12841_1 /TAXON_ID=342587 /ORGANISM="Karlodinium micrum, Strain CCMP2283" /LENGTH=180 /DNA_ID=CAMNT_0009144887 /DNA_START=82 /DNA_END=624 /DNA_ORIENTATION=-